MGALIALLNEYPQKYKIAGTYITDGICKSKDSEMDHIIDQLLNEGEYKSRLCKYCNAVFGITGQACPNVTAVTPPVVPNVSVATIPVVPANVTNVSLPDVTTAAPPDVTNQSANATVEFINQYR